MKAYVAIATVVALLLSAGAHAQTSSERYKGKPHRSPEEWAAKRTERKLKMKDMMHSERKAFKQAHREQRIARLNAMTPEKRARVMERRQQRQEGN